MTRHKLFPAFQSIVGKLTSLGLIASGICLVSILAMILAEMFLSFASRLFPRLPGTIPFSWEYSAYLLGGVFFLGSAVALGREAHIRVSLLLAPLSDRWFRRLEILVSIVGCVFLGYLSLAVWSGMMTTYNRGTVSNSSFTPLWIAYVPLVVGLILLTLQMFLRTLVMIVDHGLRRDESAMQEEVL